MTDASVGGNMVGVLLSVEGGGNVCGITLQCWSWSDCLVMDPITACNNGLTRFAICLILSGKCDLLMKAAADTVLVLLPLVGEWMLDLCLLTTSCTRSNAEVIPHANHVASTVPQVGG